MKTRRYQTTEIVKQWPRNRLQRFVGMGMAILLLAFCSSPLFALASNIGGALYKAVIIVSNNSTSANTSVCASVNLSSPNLIAGAFANASVNNVAMKDTSGSDVTFMPGYDTNDWILFVDSIGASTMKNYLLYTAESTGGNICWFPGSVGGNTTYSATLKLGDNFTISQTAYWDTDNGTDKYSVNLTGALYIFVSPTVSRNITANIPTANWTSPTGFVATTWNDEANTFDDNLGTSGNETGWTGWTDYLTLTHAGLYTDSVRYYASFVGAGSFTNMEIDVYYDGTWNNIFTGAPAWGAWTAKDIGSTEYATSVRIRFEETLFFETFAQVFEVDFGEVMHVEAPNVVSGNHTVSLTADGSLLYLYVDGTESDNCTLTANVTDTGNDWHFFENYVCPYVERQLIYVGGVLQQDVSWEYTSGNFTDASLQGNDLIPTYRTTGSDPHVSTSLLSFQPITESEAPSTVNLTSPTDWITIPAISGNFSTTVNGTKPIPGIIKAIADAAGTPAQLPMTTIGGFIIIAVSLALSYFLKQTNSRSLFIKGIFIGALFGLFIPILEFDFWMLLYFAILAIALAMASRHQEFSG